MHFLESTTKTPSKQRTLSIVFVLSEQMLATSATLPLEQLRAAHSMARVNLPRNERTELDFVTASADGKSVNTHTGIKISPDTRIEDIEQCHIVYLPALWRNPQLQVKKNKTLINWLKKMASDGTIIAGVSTGVCFLAESGLLDGRDATTHWHYFSTFQRLYPKIQLKKKQFITRADNLFCTGSINSLADLTVYFIEKMYTKKIAQEVERHFFHEIRKNQQQREYLNNDYTIHPDEIIALTQQHIKNNLQKPIKIADLANEMGVSLRSFNRRFKQALGQTPLQYVQQEKMFLARDFIKNSNLSMAEIAYMVGYNDLEYFNNLFKKIFQLSPKQYQTTVRGKLFGP